MRNGREIQIGEGSINRYDLFRKQLERWTAPRRRAWRLGGEACKRQQT
jgi:hypothetical protein